jgi:hypothetical protein
MADLFNASANTILVTASGTASAAVPLPAAGLTLRVVSEGPSTAYIAIGGASILATAATGTKSATSTPILAGSDVCFSIAYYSGEKYVSAITDSGNSVRLWFQVSEGE